jgi:uncharacterized protein
LPTLTRRQFLKTSAAVVATAGVAATIDGVLEPHHPILNRLDIPLRRLPASLDGLTIAQLSDFHYDAAFNIIPIRKAIDIVNGLRPDLIVLTGDFVTIPVWSDYIAGAKRNCAAAVDPCAPLLASLQAPLGRYAILGNHDADSAPARIVSALQSSGIPVLRNASVPIEHHGARLWLSGIDDVIEGKPDAPAMLQHVPSGEPTILLAHEPDYADQARKLPVDLQLSGHSHGGQIRVPYLGAPVLPEMAHKYPKGLYQLGSLTLYTNVGLGMIRVPIRFDCPPEVTFITLRALNR